MPTGTPEASNVDYVVILIAAPIAVWVADKLLFRGEFTQLAMEVLAGTRFAKKELRRWRLGATAGRRIGGE